MPRSKWNVSLSSAFCSLWKLNRTFALRYASSFIRFFRSATSYTVVVSTVSSAIQRCCVPVSSRGTVPISATSPTGIPRSKRMRYTLPLRRTVDSIHSESAFVHDTPTPCRPPDVL